VSATWQPGDLVMASGYGRVQPGMVESVHPYPETTLYEVRTLPAGVRPYTSEDLTSVPVRPEPGQWWRQVDGAARLRVVAVEWGGLESLCEVHADGRPVRVGRYLLVGGLYECEGVR
jgi:hypothetical protein